ncbi:MAG: TRAP transporter small permease [Chloroflexota bacterium]
MTRARWASWVDRLSYIFGFASSITITLIGLLLCIEVVLRYGFRRSTLIADEVSVYLFIAMLYLGLAEVQRRRRDIRIDIVTSHLKRPTQQRLEKIVAVLNLPVFLLFAWRAWALVLDTYRVGETAPTILRTSIWIVQIPIALGLTVLLLQGLVELARRFSPGTTEGKEVNTTRV